MRIGILFFISLICFTYTQAQISEEFTDGDFTNNPTWQGNAADFVVDNEVLQLDAAAAGISYLSTPVDIADSTFWEFLMEIDFNPSASGNFPKYYLSSNNADLTGDLDGYYLRIGETGAMDAFEVYRQNGSTDEFLFRFATEGEMSASSNNFARVRIIRNSTGGWDCYADYFGGHCFDYEGSFTETSIPNGSHFGMVFQYTSSNTDNFFIDDIFVNAEPTNANPELALVSTNPVSEMDVELQFNGFLNVMSAEEEANYTVKDAGGATLGNPLSATIDGSSQSLVHLNVSNLPIESGTEYTICATDVLDCSGAAIGSANTGTFTIFITEEAEPGDILINEFFPDPDPSLGVLPPESDAEFVELYNQSDKAIDLSNFLLGDATSSVLLSNKIMPPLSYLIICDEEFASAYQAFGDLLAVNGLPSLNNSGDEITLERPDGLAIDQVIYNDDWYQDSDKSGGGWTLELINPNLACQGGSNWIASNSLDGGTPGQQNSVFENIPDDVAPKLIGAVAISDQQLRLEFNEIMDDAVSVSDFVISPGVGTITDIVLEQPEKTSYLLTVTAPFFQDQTTYTVTIQNNVGDCVGNSIDPTCNSLDFTFYLAEPAEIYDILINEIYADPTPSIGLPESEFLELYNRSDKIINLEGLILADRSEEIVLPFYIMLPGDYVILNLASDPSFDTFGKTLALPDFIGLGNTDDDLELLDPAGDIIHVVYYTSDWYQDGSKSEGGWSLELINPSAPCELENNWRASTNPVGGTPGQANSILNNVADEGALDLIRAFPISDTAVRLFFNKGLDAIFASDPANYQINGLDVASAFVEDPFFNTVILNLTTAIQSSQTYEVSLQSEVTDCNGNSSTMFNSTRFALPEAAEALDLIINEILYNPEVGGVDFVELYNRSDKVINLAELNIATRDEDSLITSVVPIDLDCIVFPDDYIVLTKNPIDVKSRYITENPYNFIRLSLPTYGDKEGTVTLYKPLQDDELIIDEFAYDQSYQYSLLNDKNGVSLERINPEAPTQSPDNWHSAAEQVGFATPTYQNSQFLLSNSGDGDVVWLENDRISPDEDGFEDFLLINYMLPEAGYTANVDLFDAKGRLVKDLVENSLLANEGTFKWDGITNEGTDARPGIYILLVNLLNTNGETIEYKKAFVVATRLN